MKASSGARRHEGVSRWHTSRWLRGAALAIALCWGPGCGSESVLGVTDQSWIAERPASMSELYARCSLGEAWACGINKILYAEGGEWELLAGSNFTDPNETGIVGVHGNWKMYA